MRTLPKLTVRVRFPSPAPNAKNVAAHANSTVSLKQVNAHSRPETALVPPRVPIGHLGECSWRLSVPKLTVRVRFPSPAPHAKNVAAQANRWIPGLCRSVLSVHARATLGHRYAHVNTHLQFRRTLRLFHHVLRLSVLVG